MILKDRCFLIQTLLLNPTTLHSGIDNRYQIRDFRDFFPWTRALDIYFFRGLGR
jgi:hypothetical protein